MKRKIHEKILELSSPVSARYSKLFVLFEKKSMMYIIILRLVFVTQFIWFLIFFFWEPRLLSVILIFSAISWHETMGLQLMFFFLNVALIQEAVIKCVKHNLFHNQCQKIGLKEEENSLKILPEKL